MTDLNQQLHDKAEQLSSALKAYHVATTPLEKQSKAALAQRIVEQLSGSLAQLLGVQVPEGVTASISGLIGNVMRMVGAVQAELAQGLGG
jgi:hypothetical protein